MSKLIGVGVLIAIVLALTAYSMAGTSYNPQANNTDLYGTLRTNDTVYWSNDSITDVYIIFHSIGTGAAQNFDSNFSINGIVVQDRDFRTSAGVGFHEHWGFAITVPRGANFSVRNSTNVYQIEWREYPSKR